MFNTQIETNIFIINTFTAKSKKTGEPFYIVNYALIIKERQKGGFNGLTPFETFVDSSEIYEKATKNINNHVIAILTLSADKENKFTPSITQIK